jgi:hypothetical protein
MRGDQRAIRKWFSAELWCYMGCPGEVLILGFEHGPMGDLPDKENRGLRDQETWRKLRSETIAHLLKDDSVCSELLIDRPGRL